MQTSANHIVMSESEWIEKYKPIPSSDLGFHGQSGCDFGYGQCLIDPSANLSKFEPGKIWTMIDSDPNDDLVSLARKKLDIPEEVEYCSDEWDEIIDESEFSDLFSVAQTQFASGSHVVNRIGYIITENPVEDGLIIDVLDDDVYEALYGEQDQATEMKP